MWELVLGKGGRTSLRVPAMALTLSGHVALANSLFSFGLDSPSGKRRASQMHEPSVVQFGDAQAQCGPV